MVDSMIVVDIIHFGNKQNDHVLVVFGDDDLWPGIRVALLSGATITHVIPNGSSRENWAYRRLTTQSYTRLSL